MKVHPYNFESDLNSEASIFIFLFLVFLIYFFISLIYFLSLQFCIHLYFWVQFISSLFLFLPLPSFFIHSFSLLFIIWFLSFYHYCFLYISFVLIIFSFSISVSFSLWFSLFYSSFLPFLFSLLPIFWIISSLSLLFFFLWVNFFCFFSIKKPFLRFPVQEN